MGIQGLLPVLKSITRPVHVSEYRGQRVAIDAYCWLHRGAYTCSVELCEGTPTDKYVSFCMARVRMLQHYGVVPVMVFDGANLPMKAQEETTRKRSRVEQLERARAHLRVGNSTAAYECYQRAVDISPAVAKRLIDALKKSGVETIVAPYEADAQMAFLAISGSVHAVITEDSDLLTYGCPRVLFKLDRSGEGQQVLLGDLSLNRDISFVGFTQQMFVETCILAGCDFVKGLPGIGMKKAHTHMKRLRSFLKVARMLRYNGTSVPRSYESDLQRALWTFRHQRVLDPAVGRMVHLTQLPHEGLVATSAQLPAAATKLQAHELDFLGPLLTDDVVCGIADGSLNPHTLQPYEEPVAMPADLAADSAAAHPAATAARPPGGCRGLSAQRNGILAYFGSAPAATAMCSAEAAAAFKPPRLNSAPSIPAFGSQVTRQPQHVPRAALHDRGYSSQPETNISGSSAMGSPTASEAEEDASSPPKRTNAPFRRPRPLGTVPLTNPKPIPSPHLQSAIPKVLGSRAPKLLPGGSVGDSKRNTSRFFGHAPSVAELQAENAALGDQLVDQLADKLTRPVAIPRPTVAASAAAAAPVVLSEEPMVVSGVRGSAVEVRPSAGAIRRRVAGEKPMGGIKGGGKHALAEPPALANFSMRVPSSAPLPSPTAKHTHKTPQRITPHGARLPPTNAPAEDDDTAHPSIPQGNAARVTPLGAGAARSPRNGPAECSSGKRKRAVGPAGGIDSRTAGDAHPGVGATRRRLPLGGIKEVGGAVIDSDGVEHSHPTPAAIKDLSYLQGFAQTARGALDRLRPPKPGRRQVGLTLTTHAVSSRPVTPAAAAAEQGWAPQQSKVQHSTEMGLDRPHRHASAHEGIGEAAGSAVSPTVAPQPSVPVPQNMEGLGRSSSAKSPPDGTYTEHHPWQNTHAEPGDTLGALSSARKAEQRPPSSSVMNPLPALSGDLFLGLRTLPDKTAKEYDEPSGSEIHVSDSSDSGLHRGFKQRQIEGGTPRSYTLPRSELIPSSPELCDLYPVDPTPDYRTCLSTGGLSMSGDSGRRRLRRRSDSVVPETPASPGFSGYNLDSPLDSVDQERVIQTRIQEDDKDAELRAALAGSPQENLRAGWYNRKPALSMRQGNDNTAGLFLISMPDPSTAYGERSSGVGHKAGEMRARSLGKLDSTDMWGDLICGEMLDADPGPRPWRVGHSPRSGSVNAFHELGDNTLAEVLGYAHSPSRTIDPLDGVLSPPLGRATGLGGRQLTVSRHGRSDILSDLLSDTAPQPCSSGRSKGPENPGDSAMVIFTSDDCHLDRLGSPSERWERRLGKPAGRLEACWEPEGALEKGILWDDDRGGSGGLGIDAINATWKDKRKEGSRSMMAAVEGLAYMESGHCVAQQGQEQRSVKSVASLRSFVCGI